jgi:hypothetical protein
MKTFEEYLSGVARRYGSFNILFENGMYSLLSDVERIVKVLREAGVSFELIGGVAVNAHLLAAKERSRTFVTRDVDLLVDRSELAKIVEASEANGYQAKKIIGGYMLIRPDQRPADAVHMVFAGEKSKSTQPVVHPQVRAEEIDLFELRIPVAPLSDLVRMKLSSLRTKDLVHLQILDDAELITPDIERELPPVLEERLKQARKQFEQDQPDVE